MLDKDIWYNCTRYTKANHTTSFLYLKTNNLFQLPELSLEYSNIIISTSYSSLNFSGEKISPIEVDAVLLSHPEIAQAVAFGVPDDKYGEEVRIISFRFYLERC